MLLKQFQIFNNSSEIKEIPGTFWKGPVGKITILDWS
jgi:hypothetical protein